MNIKNFVLLVAVVAFGSANAFGQTDFFWSFSDLNTGASNSDASAEFSPGSSGSIFLYYTTNGPADSDISVGAFLDIMTSQSGVVQFTGAETFEFSISLFGTPLGSRWGDVVGVTGTVTDEMVDELSAFSIFSGMGILEANNGSAGLLDEGYDAGADAFLFGRLDFTVSENPGDVSVDIMVTAGDGGIVNSGLPVAATFGNATINIAQEIVPGDVDGDGVVNTCDVGPFVQLIVTRQYQEEGDINGDGRVDLRDIAPFVELLKSP